MIVPLPAPIEIRPVLHIINYYNIHVVKLYSGVSNSIHFDIDTS